jgi:hypothetical protein
MSAGHRPAYLWIASDKALNEFFDCFPLFSRTQDLFSRFGEVRPFLDII